MLSQELNNQLTRVDKGQPAGEVLRRYWQPAALAEELDTERPVVPVTLFGEKLVLFRDSHGVLGLLDRACPHRGVDLCYGRLENDGLRCSFHGWKFAANGQCMEQPGEPEGSEFYKRLTTTAYPVVEKNGIIFAYMGPGEPPPFPNFDCFRAPSTHVFAFKGLWECNWLQALEVGIDPTHASFLHRFLEDEDPEHGYGQQFRDQVSNSEMTRTEVMRRFPRPDITVDETEFGLKLTSLRHMDNGHTYVRISNAIFPSAICIAMSREMTITQWHVPIDNDRCYWYSMFTSFDQPVDKTLMREQRMELYKVPDYKPRLGRFNNWGYDPAEQESETYTGMGMDINVHDQWAVESPGPITDRSKEHLAGTDVAISRYRSMLLRAMDIAANPDRHGELPLYRAADGNSLGPEWHDSVMTANCPREEWLADYQERRDGSGW